MGILTKLKKFFIANKTAVIIVLAVITLDRITKELTLILLRPRGYVEIFKFLRLTYVENTGMAFGLFHNANLFLLVVMLAVMIFIVKSWKELTALRPPLGLIGVSLILGGAAGNVYDRITLGFVVDMIDFRVWPVFNAADSAICVGAALLAFTMLASKKTEGK